VLWKRRGVERKVSVWLEESTMVEYIVYHTTLDNAYLVSRVFLECCGRGEVLGER
jgi:hypothetical protein